MRPLTARQRMFLRSPNPNVVMVGRIRGTFSISEFEEALISLEEIHPLLKVKIQLDDDNKAWFSQEVDNPISVELVTEDWRSVARKELEYQHPVFEGPLIRFKLIEQGEEIHVVINCHHSICDALSIVYLLRDLLQVLSGEVEKKQVIEPTLVSEETVPVGVKGNFLVRWLMGRFNNKWQSADHKIEDSDFEQIPEIFWKSNSFEIHQKQLSDDETSQIIERAKGHDITVGSFLLTALIASQQQVQKKKEYHEQIVVSVDFRDRLQPNPGDAFCFYASAVRPKIQYDKGKTVWENSESVYKKLKDLLTDKNIFESQRIGNLDQELLDAFHLYRHDLLEDETIKKIVTSANLIGMNSGICFTNLGRLDIPLEYGQCRLLEIIGPFVGSDTIEKYMGVSTLGGRISLSLIHEVHHLEPKTAARVLDKTIDIALGRDTEYE